MKKLVSTFLLAILVTFSSQAQERRKGERPQLTVEQQTDLMVKKMTLSLDLSKKQQQQIMPLLKKQAEQRQVAMQRRKEMREKDIKPTADAIYKMRSNQLDNQIAFKNNMKQILDKDQFERFEKMAKARKMRVNKEMKGRMNMKKGPMDKKGWNRKD